MGLADEGPMDLVLHPNGEPNAVRFNHDESRMNFIEVRWIPIHQGVEPR
jgi:hypothetical protein